MAINAGKRIPSKAEAARKAKMARDYRSPTAAAKAVLAGKAIDDDMPPPPLPSAPPMADTTPRTRALEAIYQIPHDADFVLLYMKEGRIERISSEMPIERFIYWMELLKMSILKSILP